MILAVIWDRSFFMTEMGGGGGWWDLMGAMPKICFQRGAQPKHIVSKGGQGHQIIAFKFGNDSICNNANISARMLKKSVSKVLKIPIFPGEHAPGPPYFIIHPTANLPHQLFCYKIQPGECHLFFGLCWSIPK